MVSVLTDLVFPRACASCGLSLSGKDPLYFCPGCLEALLSSDGAIRCPRCGLGADKHVAVIGSCTYCRGRNFQFDRAVAVGRYEGALRELLLRFKFGKERFLGRALAELLQFRLLKENALESVDVILPVPLHFWRRFSRGFNQAELIARRVAEVSKIPFLPGLLVRKKNTPSQTMLPRRLRLQGLRRAFAAKSRERVRGRHLLLVDDVLTTGTTASACARVLKVAGARRVTVAVIARTDLDQENFV